MKLGWKRHIRGRCRVVSVAGDHDTYIRNFARETGKTLGGLLEDANRAIDQALITLISRSGTPMALQLTMRRISLSIPLTKRYDGRRPQKPVKKMRLAFGKLSVEGGMKIDHSERSLNSGHKIKVSFQR